MKVKAAQLCRGSLQPHGLYSSLNSPGQNTGVGSLSLLQGIFPTQGSIPGLPHCRQILYQLSHKQSPRILEWVALPFSKGSSQPRTPTLQVDSLPAEPQGKPKNTGVGSLSLLQRIFLTQEWNQGLQHCRQNFDQLSSERKPLGNKGQIQTVADQAREEMQKQRRNN